MSRSVQSSSPKVRRPVIWMTGLLAVAVLSGVWIYRASRPPVDSSQSEEVAPQSSKPAAPNKPAEDSELHPLTAEEIANAPRPPAVIQSTSRVTPTAAPAAAPRAQPTPYTQQLVASLTQLDFSHGPIPGEQAAQWTQGLKTLTEQGAVAVPAIREFLEKNVDFDYSAVKGGQLLEQSSLRGALLEALQQIGGPEATDLMLQTLRTSALPSEIARLAEYLDKQAPGQYRQETVSAINEVLAMASGGQLPGWDMAPLFPVLAKYGDPSTVQELQSKWRYYATMSLAGLEGGEGIPTLIRQVQDPAAGSKNDFALQMLAQEASVYPDATAALIEQARMNRIPESAWRKIVTGLAGDQYFMGPQPVAPGATLPGLKTYHIESGNQNFYSLPVTSTDPQISQRLAVIDQLLAATSSNPTAQQALQRARESLTHIQ